MWVSSANAPEALAALVTTLYQSMYWTALSCIKIQLLHLIRLCHVIYVVQGMQRLLEGKSQMEISRTSPAVYVCVPHNLATVGVPPLHTAACEVHPPVMRQKDAGIDWHGKGSLWHTAYILLSQLPKQPGWLGSCAGRPEPCLIFCTWQSTSGSPVLLGVIIGLKNLQHLSSAAEACTGNNK
jgi:hypothetical protein